MHHSASQCIKRVDEINPPECPKCNSTISKTSPKLASRAAHRRLLHDTAEIKKIMQSLGLPDPPSASFRRGLLGSSAHRLSPDEALEAKSDYTAPPPSRRPSTFDDQLFVDDLPDYE